MNESKRAPATPIVVVHSPHPHSHPQRYNSNRHRICNNDILRKEIGQEDENEKNSYQDETKENGDEYESDDPESTDEEGNEADLYLFFDSSHPRVT